MIQLAGLGDLVPSAGQAGVTGTFSSVPSIISLIFTIIVAAAGAIFMILLIVGGIQYLTGAGNEEATGAAKKRMIDAIIGLIIVLAAWAIGTWVLTKLETGTFSSGGGGTQTTVWTPEKIETDQVYQVPSNEQADFIKACGQKGADFEASCNRNNECQCSATATPI